MAIKKQEFYEGAALHLIARSGAVTSIAYEAPFFFLNKQLAVLLKYSTKGRSPWGFTFTPGEQALLEVQSSRSKTAVALICGSDGVAAFSFESYSTIASVRRSAIHISCYRQHGEHYEINGPDGALSKKIAPANWQRILSE